jgi:chitodextrinase
MQRLPPTQETTDTSKDTCEKHDSHFLWPTIVYLREPKTSTNKSKYFTFTERQKKTVYSQKTQKKAMSGNRKCPYL